jgi:hypothetical protein
LLTRSSKDSLPSYRWGTLDDAVSDAKLLFGIDISPRLVKKPSARLYGQVGDGNVLRDFQAEVARQAEAFRGARHGRIEVVEPVGDIAAPMPEGFVDPNILQQMTTDIRIMRNIVLRERI